jgi:adenosylhomocysteine nucleosidase
VAPVNIGALNTGSGRLTVGGDAVGQQVVQAPAPRTAPDPGGPAVDVGVLTVLPLEMAAVAAVLQRAGGYRTFQVAGGAQVHRARLPGSDGPVDVVAMQTVDRGPRSAALAYRALRQLFAPPLVLLVGIAGGIGRGVGVGDVVISDQVVYYDARKVAADGVHRRGQSQAVAPVLRNRLNEFFRRHGEEIEVGSGTVVRMHWGPIGSGDAVVADRHAEIRRFLLAFNDKTLAVETEAAGVAQAFYEEVDTDQALRGWLTLRGVCDLADAGKDDRAHTLAAYHAAEVMAQLLPLLKLTG